VNAQYALALQLCALEPPKSSGYSKVVWMMMDRHQQETKRNLRELLQSMYERVSRLVGEAKRKQANVTGVLE
jgi:hypothetical protein